MRLDFRAEFFNVFNRLQFGAPNSDLDTTYERAHFHFWGGQHDGKQSACDAVRPEVELLSDL
jgi:hypothetical protein